MIVIQRATASDASLLSPIAIQAHMESHGHSASLADHELYIQKKLTVEAFITELNIPEYIYHLIFVDGNLAGYSKIIFDFNHAEIAEQPVTKLERIYLIKPYYGMDLGKKLFDHNVSL